MALECKRFLGEKRTCYNCGERGHLSRDCSKPREKRVAQAEQSYMQAKKAFKAAKVKAAKAGKKASKKKLATPLGHLLLVQVQVKLMMRMKNLLVAQRVHQALAQVMMVALVIT